MSSFKHYLDKQVLNHCFPGYSYSIITSGGCEERDFGGSAIINENNLPITSDTLFDVASITKPIVTATAFMLLVEKEDLDLEMSLDSILNGDCPVDKKHITLIDLLCHRSGYPAWVPLYAMCRKPEFALTSLLNLPLIYPPGQQCLYSCLDYIVLGSIFPIITGERLVPYAQKNIFNPLAMTSSCFNPEKSQHMEIAATEYGNFYEYEMMKNLGFSRPPLRDYQIMGEVHDGNAFFLGGEAGNAGLFSAVKDIERYIEMILNCGQMNGRQFMKTATIKHMISCFCSHEEERFGIGWHLKYPNWSGGEMFSDQSIGHTGFTGCSIYLDLERKIGIILFTNRVHGDAYNNHIRTVRKEFNNLIIKKYDL